MIFEIFLRVNDLHKMEVPVILAADRNSDSATSQQDVCVWKHSDFQADQYLPSVVIIRISGYDSRILWYHNVTQHMPDNVSRATPDHKGSAKSAFCVPTALKTIKIEPVHNEISIVETRTFPRVAKLAHGVANLADVHKLKDFQKQAMRIATLPKSFHTKLEMIELDIFVGGTINWAQRVKSECRENSVPLRQFYIDYKYHMLREVGYEFLEGEEGVMNESTLK
ncbi:Protein CBG17808 [Caenorhabditis briggsae]|uniref:Protein CBG17808 n=1 Tax=Caenorhabditis briggsae TaxID=6238 RepID=A8XRU5_CAEBR|nr:Protein CBG17808 [Caenorhabditis briggsae]CAP35370.2 Protein CBG17808 [Caenorhabditis briggsae]